MSFISSIFKGASNDFTPQNPYGGAKPLVQDSERLTNMVGGANSNYGTANAGLQDLASQLKAQSLGQGPNLANAQLQQATGQNVANQAALAAGQRGASSNVGLIARQAAQTGANIQQQAAGQASINRLQQQLSAQQQLGSTLGTQGALANQYGGIAQQAIANQNAGIAGAQANVNQIGAQQAQQNAQMNQGILGGIGGVIGGLASPIANSLFGGASNPVSGAKNIAPSGSAGSAYGSNMMFAAEGGQVPELPQQTQFGHRFINKHTQHFAQGGMAEPMMKEDYMHFHPQNFKMGGQVPGQPKVQGNSPQNDTVPAMLSPEEIVIPNSVTQSSDPVGNGAKFIEQTLRKKLGGKR